MKTKNYEDLKFIDDFLFCKILSSNPELCRELVSLVLNKDIGAIQFASKQKPIEITADGKGIRLDVYIDNPDTVYDIEMQTTMSKDLAKRTRYYQGMIDLDLIERGAKYSELKESYIIFICLEDPFDKNLPVYTMRNRCIEDEEVELNDGATKVFVNANGSDENISSDLREFLKYLATGISSGRFTDSLEEEVVKAQQKTEWRAEYMTLAMKYQEKYDEGKVATCISLVRKGLLSIQDAAQELNIPVQEFEEILNDDRNQ